MHSLHSRHTNIRATHATLPEPSVDARAHSDLLTQEIQAHCIRNQNWLSFDTFMNLALYYPNLGYYSGQSLKFGREGDFTTAPEISPLFAETFAHCFIDWMRLSAPTILEFGAGSGQFALDCLRYLEMQNNLPEHYYIVELSSNLRMRQQAYLTHHIPHLMSKITWLETLPSTFNGIIFANEVLDALPQHLVIQHDTLHERGVAVTPQGQFAWQDKPANQSLCQAVAAIEKNIGYAFTHGYLTEISLQQTAWLNSLADCLQTGIICLVDYGFNQSEFYHPQRNQGTLMCHYQHHSHANPFLYPGLQDITAHVDFTAVADTLYHRGLDLLGFASQGAFLLQAGILNRLEQHQQSSSEIQQYQLKHGLQQLVSEAEMGSLFKVIAFSKGINPSRAEIYFSECDRSYTL